MAGMCDYQSGSLKKGATEEGAGTINILGHGERTEIEGENYVMVKFVKFFIKLVYISRGNSLSAHLDLFIL